MAQAGAFAKINLQLRDHEPSAKALEELAAAKDQMELMWKVPGIIFSKRSCRGCATFSFQHMAPGCEEDHS